jgi:hypothetical protein
MSPCSIDHSNKVVVSTFDALGCHDSNFELCSLVVGGCRRVDGICHFDLTAATSFAMFKVFAATIVLVALRLANIEGVSSTKNLLRVEPATAPDDRVYFGC